MSETISSCMLHRNSRFRSSKTDLIFCSSFSSYWFIQQISIEHLISALDTLLSSEVTAMNKVLSCQELTLIGFPGGSDGKEPAYNVGDPGSIPGLGRSLREGNDNPLWYSCLENPMDRGTWWAIVHGVAKSWTWLSDFHFHFRFIEKTN